MYESLSTGQNCLLSLILASDCGDLTVWAILRPYNIQYKISILLRLAKSNNFNGFVCRVWPWPKTSFSTHISLVTHICVNLLCIHWCTRWRGVLYVTSHYVNQCPVNSSWPGDACCDVAWRHRSESTLAQVMACCLMSPSHFLSWTNVDLSSVKYILLGAISQQITQPPTSKISLKIIYLKSPFKCPWGQYHWRIYKICRNNYSAVMSNFESYRHSWLGLEASVLSVRP